MIETGGRDRISINPEICHGNPCIRGTRVMVSVILDNLAAGETPEEIMRGYHVERADIEAAMHFASQQAVEPRVRILHADGTGTP